MGVALSSVGFGLSTAGRLSQLRDAFLNQTRRELTWTNAAPRGAEPGGDLAQLLPRFRAETHEATDGPCRILPPIAVRDSVVVTVDNDADFAVVGLTSKPMQERSDLG